MRTCVASILAISCAVISSCGRADDVNTMHADHHHGAPSSDAAQERGANMNHSSVTAPAVADEHAGKAVFTRCAACHLPTGAGVPGAYPPLDDHIVDLASTSAGREYLVMVVQSGLVGAIKVHNQEFAGAMPAQGSALRSDQIADVLNFVVEELNERAAGAAADKFTAAEVEAVVRKYSAISAADKLALRQSALEDLKK